MELKIIQVFPDGEEKENQVDSKTLSVAEITEWGLLETGRIIIFLGSPCVIPASDTNYLPSGKIKKTIYIRELTNEEKAEIERRQRQMIESASMQQMAQQSGLVIPAGAPPMSPQQEQLLRNMANG